MNELIKITNEIKKLYEESLKRPTKIKVNEQWMQKQLDDELIVKTEGKSINSFTGVPLEIDNNIETFKIIYRDEYLDYMEKITQQLYESMGVSEKYLK